MLKNPLKALRVRHHRCLFLLFDLTKTGSSVSVCVFAVNMCVSQFRSGGAFCAQPLFGQF